MHAGEPSNISGPPQPALSRQAEIVRVPIHAWFLLYVTIAALYVLTAAGRNNNGDAFAMFNVTQSLATQGSLSSDPCEFEPRTNHCVPGVDGRHYSGFGLVPSIVSVPAYWAAEALSARLHRNMQVAAGFCVSLNHALIAALVPLVLALWLTRLRFSPRAAASTALLYAFASPAWFYSKTFASEPYFILGLIGCCCLLATSDRPIPVLLAGCGLAFAFASRIYGLILTPFILVYAIRLWREQSRSPRRIAKNLLLFAAPIFLGLSALAYSYYIRFGNIFKTGYHLNYPHIADLMSTPLPTGLKEILVNPQSGILLYVPWIAIVPFVWRRFWKEHRSEAVLVLGIFLTNYLFFAKYAAWEGGWALGPRMMSPTIPFLALPLAALFSDGAAVLRTWTGRAAAALAALALLIQLIEAPYPGTRYFYLETYNEAHGLTAFWSGQPLLEAATALPGLLFGSRYQDHSAAHQFLLTFPNSVNLVRADLWLLKVRLFGVPKPLALVLAIALLLVACWACTVALSRFSQPWGGETVEPVGRSL